MQSLSPSQEIDPELLTTHYKTITFKATLLELWDRTVQGKAIGVRTQSMLPQINLSSKVIKTLSASTRLTKVGVCVASKYSPTHYLSLFADECVWPELQNYPKADYLIYLKPSNVNKIIDHLSHEEKILENFMQSLEKILNRRQKVEILDVCRTMIMFAKDKYTNKLLIRCEILFPYINLLFTPISAIKLVSSSLTKKLIHPHCTEFQNGFLTMDQDSRIFPLDFNDKSILKYPIVGIWVKGIPQTNTSSKYSNLVHPLVWAACVQFITFNGFKEKISSSLPSPSFLFIDFSVKPKFYEASSQKQPVWKTSLFSTDIDLNTEICDSIQINFLKKDTRFTLKLAVSDSLSYISQSASNSRSGTPPSAKPPIHRMNPTYSSSKDLRPQSYKQIITEQTKLIEKLQAQVHKLQSHVISPKSKSYVSSPVDSDNFKVTTETNTTFSIYPSNRLKSSKKITFETDEKIDEGVEEKKHVYVSKGFSHPKTSEKIPQINYKSSSESSEEEENVKIVQFKYLKNYKK
jgi:SCL-interrupting locus protein N-terminus